MTFPGPEAELEKMDYFLLGWLNGDDWSIYGECRGESFDRLKKVGFVEHRDPLRVNDFSLVRLTEKGFEFLRNLKR